jgi:prepilin-type N-terminal cleavage/methylation domain-containing protein
MMRADAGFTLIETLVALAILSVALVMLYGAGATSLMSSKHIANIDQVVLLAQSKLDELAVSSAPLPPRASGIFSDTDIHWIATTKIVPGNAASSTLVLQDVQLQLQWRNGLHYQSLDVQTRHLGSAQP